MVEESVFLVADGVGGNKAGEIASRTTVSQIVEYIRKHPLGEISGASSSGTISESV